MTDHDHTYGSWRYAVVPGNYKRYCEWWGAFRHSDLFCTTCNGLWPDFCTCPDRNDEVAARDEANRDDS